MTTRIIGTAILTLVLALGLRAQTYVNEDFSTGVGTTLPVGWTSSQTGTNPALWRHDNPGGRTFAPPFAGTFVIADDDVLGSSASGNSILTSPAFNAAGTTLLNLDFDHQFRALQSTGDFAQVEVFDGAVWNVITNYTTNQGYLLPNADTTVSASFDITAAAGGAANAQIRFNYNYGWDWWWALDNVMVSQPPAVDLALQSIDVPANDPDACLPLAGTYPVTVTYANDGALPVLAFTQIDLQLEVNGSLVSYETVFPMTDLNPGMSASHTFLTPALLPSPGPNSITATVILAGDLDTGNDAKTENYVGAGAGSLQPLPYVQNFDAGASQNSTTFPTGWVQDLADGSGTDSNWYLHSGTTTTANTGPIADHTTGFSYYAYVEDEGNFAQVNLLTPCFDLGLTANPMLEFWRHSFNANPTYTTNENFLAVDVFAYPSGAVTLDVFGPAGHQPTSPTWSTSLWTQQSVSLAAFSGQTVRIRFRGQSSGGSNSHDIGIDDLKVFDMQPTPGQAPRPGLAVFDINGALNANGAPISSGLGGPYFAAMTQGQNFTMSFDGAPNQAMAIVYGALNPVVATYPGGIGQLDVGGPGVGPGGLPLNLGIFVNAIAYAQGGFQGLPYDALFFTTSSGGLALSLPLPNFGLPAGTVLTSFQAAITTPAAPFVYLSNAIQVQAF